VSSERRGPAEDFSPAFRLMGVLNVTPDSFSDGGLYLDPENAIAHGLELIDEGADILDIGGESTRPGAEPVTADIERARVLPVLDGLASSGTNAQLSIDTSKASVAEASTMSRRCGAIPGWRRSWRAATSTAV